MLSTFYSLRCVNIVHNLFYFFPTFSMHSDIFDYNEFCYFSSLNVVHISNQDSMYETSLSEQCYPVVLTIWKPLRWYCVLSRTLWMHHCCKGLQGMIKGSGSAAVCWLDTVTVDRVFWVAPATLLCDEHSLKLECVESATLQASVPPKCAIYTHPNQSLVPTNRHKRIHILSDLHRGTHAHTHTHRHTHTHTHTHTLVHCLADLKAPCKQ